MSQDAYISFDEIGRFAMIPFTFIEGSKQLSFHARWLFVVLMYYRNTETGNSFPSYETVYQKFGIRKEMMAKAIRELEEKGWLKRKKRFSKSTIYTLIFPAPVEDEPF
jgi:hypothetical protein